MPSKTPLGARLPNFIADYNASVPMPELVAKYGRTKKSLNGIAFRNGGTRPNHYPSISDEERESIRVRYVGGAAATDLAKDTNRSRQTLWYQVFRHLTPAEHAARKTAKSA